MVEDEGRDTDMTGVAVAALASDDREVASKERLEEPIESEYLRLRPEAIVGCIPEFSLVDSDLETDPLVHVFGLVRDSVSRWVEVWAWVPFCASLALSRGCNDVL